MCLLLLYLLPKISQHGALTEKLIIGYNYLSGKERLLKVEILLGMDDPGCFVARFSALICSSPLGHLSVHCSHCQGNHRW